MFSGCWHWWVELGPSVAGCMAGDLWDNTESTNICIVGDPERGEREKKAENLLQVIIGENFPNLGKETEIQVQEALRISDKMNPKRSTPRHIIIKMAKIKDRQY